MRTTAVLVILLLVVGLNLGASVARAGDHAVIQPLPTACQPVSDVELSHIRGKFQQCCPTYVSLQFPNFTTHVTIALSRRIRNRTDLSAIGGGAIFFHIPFDNGGLHYSNRTIAYRRSR